jgi:hypothetical protein
MNFKNLWALEYSVKQKAFHLDKLQDTCFRNMKNVLLKKSLDYVIVFVGDHQECYVTMEQLRDKGL